jgi:hypothetical protein
VLVQSFPLTNQPTFGMLVFSERLDALAQWPRETGYSLPSFDCRARRYRREDRGVPPFCFGALDTGVRLRDGGS